MKDLVLFPIVFLVAILLQASYKHFHAKYTKIEYTTPEKVIDVLVGLAILIFFGFYWSGIHSPVGGDVGSAVGAMAGYGMLEFLANVMILFLKKLAYKKYRILFLNMFLQYVTMIFLQISSGFIVGFIFNIFKF